jgi:hypothetical protein
MHLGIYKVSATVQQCKGRKSKYNTLLTITGAPRFHITHFYNIGNDEMNGTTEKNEKLVIG